MTIEDLSATTDSLRRYAVFHVPGGESHAVTVSKVHFETFETYLTMGYADLDSFDFVLGKILSFSDLFQGPTGESKGLAWIGDITWSSDGLRKRMYVHDGALEWMSSFDAPGSFPPGRNTPPPMV
ncbi:MAG: hypothetical protein JSV84_11870 [Gemmatimonadota bacterium]|nr:MAG: hypothetical protein JSV84_11870 [Gemmatimonadota bacterium]